MTVDNRREEAETILADAELIHTAEVIEQAVEQMASDITAELSGKNPLVLCVMIGGVVISGKLIPRLNFPMEIDYIHATRYRNETSGDVLEWKKEPSISLLNRTVLLIDDILDEGITLEHIVHYCNVQQATRVYTAVLTDKAIGRPRTFSRADFTGLTVPDRYVFGCGMDYKGYLRNLPEIYAVKEA